VQLRSYQKQPNLKLKTQAKQLFRFSPLSIHAPYLPISFSWIKQL